MTRVFEHTSGSQHLSAVTPATKPAAKSTEPSWETLNQIIEDALEFQHLTMVYQPLFSMQDSRMVGFEALVRCQSPQFGFISPDQFIPHAEQSGRIVELGDWIFQQTLVDLKRMMQYGMKDVCLSLNVSPVQITSGDVFERIMGLVAELGIPPRCLKLELTETALIQNPQALVKTFDAFQKEGVEIWVDDFGTGFASLSLLRKFRVDGLKIDRSFIEGIAENNEDFTLCSAVIAMAQRLGLSVVAEGVEDEVQLQILSQLGCDVAQGYLLGRPVSLEQNLKDWAS